MTQPIEFRDTNGDDIPSLCALYPLIFPDEDLRPLVTELLEEPRHVLSLTAVQGERLIAHVLFTLCDTADGTRNGALLGPLGVHPDRQGQGIGTRIIHAGHDRLANHGVSRVFVLGDPGFYGRLGFATEQQVLPPYPLPNQWREAWQFLSIGDSPAPGPGALRLPAPWMDPALWQP